MTKFHKKNKKTKSLSNQRRSKGETTSESISAEEKVNLDLNIHNNPTDFFTKNTSFDQHFEAQTKSRDRYLAILKAFDEYSIEIASGVKSKILSSAYARHDHKLVDFILNEHKQFGFVDVLKAVTSLDSVREKKAIEKKLARITRSGSVMRPSKAQKYKVDLNNLTTQTTSHGTCSGALQKHIKRYIRTFKESQLEFFALQLPTEPWKKLANIIHLNPTKDFPNAPWFLPYCFTGKAPEGSKLEKCKNINSDNVNDLVDEFNLPYSFVKKYTSKLTEKSKLKLAENMENIDSILWHYEDLKCPKVDNIVKARLENGEKINLPYGKLMERLLTLKDQHKLDSFSDKNSVFSLMIPYAETRLQSFKSSLPGPVAVIGDASASMSVAIRTATIISSLLTAICSAKLSFFNDKNWFATVDPKNISEILQLAYSTQANCSTAPAASLVPYYEKKELIKTFIIVTDEEENTSARTENKDWRFFGLFMEYRKKVYPASLIFISFLNNQHDQGQMYKEFTNENIPDVQQFKFNGSRPDLTKLDSILGSICSKSSQSFAGYVEKIEHELKNTKMNETFEKLNVKSDEKSSVLGSETSVKTESIKINMI